MSLSRSICLLKNIQNFTKGHQHITQVTRNISHGPWNYRRSGIENVPKHMKLGADLLVGFTVWWILWHIWHEPGHIVGEYEYPDPSKWTNAELGIPPDDED
uniref:NADH dehydrogenase [ubiquinone] 1 beta subcomplex subunit 2, mitochondrial n=1 Tax=Graphocephala atropunctata TaxID=36148 RepID=A0A1B6MDD2_9HEMI